MGLCHKKSKIKLKQKLSQNSCRNRSFYRLGRILLVKVIVFHRRRVCELSLA